MMDIIKVIYEIIVGAVLERRRSTSIYVVHQLRRPEL
jgi:hypothetical protein